jgi:hypothetical protein
MAESAFQTQYRQEFIQGFERLQSYARDTVTTEVEIKGNTATFLVADSGDASAVTRGLNGLIPGRADALTQTSATLVEWHDVPKKTGFNIFASQGDQRRIMQETSMHVINRKIDDDIITELNTGTVNTGASTQASLDLVMHACTLLGNADVPFDGNISALITPAFYSYLMQTTEFASADFVDNKPFSGKNMFFRWAGVNFIVHTGLPGAATSAEKCFIYHKTALGHAINSGGIQTQVGYNEENDYSFARTTVYMGSQVLQNEGIIVVNHDGSGFAAGA